MPEIVVYIPDPEGHPLTAHIAAGSGIVGRPEPGGEDVEIYFEGNLFRAENIRTLADRANHASGRMPQTYPTTAKVTVPRDALVVVGTFDHHRGQIVLTGPHSEKEVARWIGGTELGPAELLVSSNRPPKGWG